MTATITTRSTISVAASAVRRIQLAYYEALEFDSGFDGGEFSGPANCRGQERAITEALTTLGWTRADYNAELALRTSPAYVWRSALDVEDES